MQIQNRQNQALRDHLLSQYAGVFDSISIETHIRDYVGFTFAAQVVPIVARQIPPGSRILDIGSGFGSFVIAARRLGLEAFGLEIAEFDVFYARHRLNQDAPEIYKNPPFVCGSGLKLPFDDEAFDAITLWNVLEHIPDSQLLLEETRRVLRPGGLVFIICPNYAAFRQEAHYNVSWFPMLPRPLAASYLKILGKNPTYFETSVFCRTNWELLRRLKRLNFEVRHLDRDLDKPPDLRIKPDFYNKLSHPEEVVTPWLQTTLRLAKKLKLYGLVWIASWLYALPGLLSSWIAYYRRMWKVYNPLVDSVVFSARKGLNDICQG